MPISRSCEKLFYVPCVYTSEGNKKPDYLATIDCDPDSKQYGQVAVACTHVYMHNCVCIINKLYIHIYVYV